MDNFTKYEKLKEEGASAVKVWQRAQNDGFDYATCIRLVRRIFGLNLVEAKAISMEARDGSELEVHQAKFVEGLEKTLQSKD